MRSLRLLFGLALLVSLCSCSGEVPQPAREAGSSESAADHNEFTLIPVTLALNWLPEAEHGGFYAALSKCYYSDAGLDVEILPGGPDSPVIQRVATGRVTFGISNADRIVLGRAQQAPVVGLMAPLQHSPRCIVVHEASGIESFDQLKNVTLAMSDAPAFSHYLRKKLPLEDVKIVRSTGSLGQFLEDPRFAQQGYVFSEPIVAAEQGVKTRALMVSELGFDPYSSVLMTSESLIEEDPELVRKFVEASIAGWKDYLADPQPIHEQIQQANPEMPVAVMNAGFESLKPLCLNGSGEFTGTMTAERWQTLVRQLEELELVESGQGKPDDCYTLEFLKAAN
ncbi:ABC transporter substrate-binding protein [Rubinisphaera margarita]|uniref:ABC transporter substrate-binding protein n=1 Tax=Rubinisphaera margarita TaxID=2909586 RepID=UPI001EE82560|nr:ABC transporter substrate-binding protein [Rubinisphaera margarita]MCG6157093.1 ABC transporter substrate-binding protein [Rubinisphaera margarita]